MIKPHFIIGSPDRPYLLRWYITPWSAWFRDVPWQKLTGWQRFLRTLPNIYVHCIMRSDDDRALHCHPWWNCSVVLAGGYTEVVPMRREQPGFDDHYGRLTRHHRKPGTLVVRKATDRHRLEVAKPCWSLFITGPKVRDWGFHCERGFVPWQQFVQASNSGEVGRGCA